jgi:hypothetical protein
MTSGAGRLPAKPQAGCARTSGTLGSPSSLARKEIETVKATWRGHVIAESDRVVEVDGYWYFPRESVRMELLRAAPMTPDDRV